MSRPLQTRNAPDQDKLLRRGLTMLAGRGAPSTLDEEARTVQVVAATEEPTEVYDWQRGRVREVLLMSGLAPVPGQVPLLDTHNRWSTEDVLGSLREFVVEDGRLLATAYFSQTAEKSFTLVCEGHLTDVSIGYRVDKYTWVDDGKTAEIDGRSFRGPIKVATKWQIKEVSAVPVGADDKAKVRAQAGLFTNRQEEGTMDEKLRKFLESRGLATEATEAEAWEHLERMNLPAEPEPGEGQQAAAAGQRQTEPTAPEILAAATEAGRQAARDERRRIVEVRAMGAQFSLDDEDITRMINKGTSLDECRKQVITLAAQASPDTQGGAGHRAPAQVTEDGRDKFRAAASDSLLLRGGIAVESPAEGHDGDVQGYTLAELARECLAQAGQRPTGSRLEMVGRALSTSDLPYILGNVANISLQAGYAAAEETWPLWCDTGSVSDFKIHTAVRDGDGDDLDEIPEGGEYKYGKASEEFEQYAVVTFGKLFAIHRQSIINDDLGTLTNTPKKQGLAAARKVGDLPYAVLTANADMGDGTPLFHADHSNLAASGAAPGQASLAAAIKTMKLQTGVGGVVTQNIRPKFFIAPVSLEGSTEVYFNTFQILLEDNSAYENPYGGSYFTRVYEPRLDANSPTAWYLAAAKGQDGVTVFFLDGVQAPYLETKAGWNVDGVEYKVRIDAGAKAMNWRPLVRNPGA